MLSRPSSAVRALEGALAALFVGAGGAKLLGIPAMVVLFARVGMGQWLRYVVGACELTGALLLLSASTAGLGALLLAGIMVGAIATMVFVLDRAPIAPTLVLAALGAVGRVRWPVLLAWWRSRWSARSAAQR